MKIAEQLNDTLRRLWEDCKVKKLNEIVKGIEGISNEQVLSVLQGEKNFMILMMEDYCWKTLLQKNILVLSRY